MKTMKSFLRIVVCQMNPRVGDIDGNTGDILAFIKANESADLIVFPELAITGYPPEDLLLRPSLSVRIAGAIDRIKAAVLDQFIIVGYPSKISSFNLSQSIDQTHGSLHSNQQQDLCYNLAGVIHAGEVIAEYKKRKLPNYRVFDEQRYFEAGNEVCVVDIYGIKVGVTICEDLWYTQPVAQSVREGAQLMVNLNASPYHYKKHAQRVQVVQQRIQENSVPIIYAHMVGGQDELVFDGGSFACNSHGELVMQAPWFECGSYVLSCSQLEGDEVHLESDVLSESENEIASIYQALVQGVRDYIGKNGFKGVALGLSGGIDSALTLAIAADALGAEKVEAVMMPFRYTSEMSRNDAAEQAERMGVSYKSISIEPIFDTFETALESEFLGLSKDKTEENIQARCRGVLLMAISNKKGYLVLTTGNKSEMSVGYATLYGDMAGGFAVLKDVSKMRVYELARYRNTISDIIPFNVIERPPSAELAPDQKDEDSLPPYEILDDILEKYIEDDQSAMEIIAAGFDESTVNRVLRLVDLNEYKRRQSAIGPRITPRGFGRDRRYPITNGWKIGE